MCVTVGGDGQLVLCHVGNLRGEVDSYAEEPNAHEGKAQDYCPIKLGWHWRTCRIEE